jgi:hypothetical protein
VCSPSPMYFRSLAALNDIFRMLAYQNHLRSLYDLKLYAELHVDLSIGMISLD